MHIRIKTYFTVAGGHGVCAALPLSGGPRVYFSLQIYVEIACVKKKHYI